MKNHVEVDLGSLSFDGVTFSVFSLDHPPLHVHGRYNGVEVVVVFEDGEALPAPRRRAIKPANAKQADVKKILRVAADHADTLIALWEGIHG